MNCQEMEASIPEWARDSAPVPDAALAHVRQCERCAERLDEERRLTEGLAAFADACSDERVPAEVEQKLRAAFRLRAVPAAAAPVRGVRRGVVIGAMGSVAAAIAWVTLSVPPVEPLPPRPAAIASVAVDRSVQPVAQTVRAASPRRGVWRRRPVAPPVELQTDFLPVAQGDDWTPLDGANLMRVELPKSALGAFGLPVEPGLEPERVRADVVLSDDGLLRAIRFVR
jgi:hypothetical protein